MSYSTLGRSYTFYSGADNIMRVPDCQPQVTKSLLYKTANSQVNSTLLNQDLYNYQMESEGKVMNPYKCLYKPIGTFDSAPNYPPGAAFQTQYYRHTPAGEAYRNSCPNCDWKSEVPSLKSPAALGVGGLEMMSTFELDNAKLYNFQQNMRDIAWRQALSQ